MSSARLPAAALIVGVAASLATGCALLPVHNVPTTVDPGYSQLAVSTGAGAIDGVPYYPGLPWSLTYRTGVAERHEVGGRVAQPGGANVDWKWHVHDGETADYGTGLSVAVGALAGPFPAFALPLYASWRIQQKLLFYGAVRAVVAFEEPSAPFAAATVAIGLRFGTDRTGVYVELSGLRTFARDANDLELPDGLSGDDLQGLWISFSPYHTMRPFNPDEMGL